MQPISQTTSIVDAKVEDVLPKLGLAFVVDDDGHGWGVTRSTPGTEFDALTTGQRVRLRLQRHPTYSVVQEYRLLD